MKSLKPFALVIVCIIASTTVYADMDLSGVVDVIRTTPANNDFVLPSDSRFERKWQNFTKAVKGNVHHNIGDAFVLIDTTVMGACDEGVLIDRLGITVQHDFSDDNGFIPWTAFAASGTVSQKDVFGDELILFENPKIAAHFVKSDFKIDNARAFFNRLLIAIRNSQNEDQLSSSTSPSQRQIQESSQVNVQDVIFNKRIEKFGGFYLGAEIRLPASCKNFGLPGYEGLLADWVEDSEYLKGAKYKYNKEDGTIMQQDMLSENVYRFVYVTPRTRLVCAVQLCYVVPSSKFARQKPLIEDFFRKEFSNSIGLPIFMNDGNVAVDKRSQIVNFQIKDVTDNGNSLRGSSVMVIDMRSYQTEAAEVDAQNAREQARINEQMAAEKARIDEENAKNQKQLQRWIEDFNSQPPFTSFCGIEFGTRLTGDLERTENGRYLCGYVELDTPFRGCDVAKVYAGVKTHRIFRVEIETKDRPGQLGAYDVGSGHIVGPGVLDKKYNPNNNPLINVNTYLATIEDYGLFQTKVMQERSRIEQMISRMEGSSSYLNYFGHLPSYYKLNGGMINVESRSVGTGDFYNTVEEHGNYALAITKEREKEVGVLIATSYKYKKIADEEYEKESGGDGSGVL